MNDIEIPDHPAEFSPEVLREIAAMLPSKCTVLDGFAGKGGIHKLATPKRPTVGWELEPLWAAAHPSTLCGDVLKMAYTPGEYDWMVTSPCYATRMADHHNAKDGSKRHTYRHYYGEPLTEGSAAMMQWGPAYKRFHLLFLIRTFDIVEKGLILNMSDHYRDGDLIPVTDWWIRAAEDVGFKTKEIRKVKTRRQKHGANAHLRAEYESVIKFAKGRV